MRTSLSHPIVIAEVRPHPGYGSIGLTLCPGKTQETSASGPWARDLQLDLDTIEHWGAAVVVSLVESSELKELKVENIGPEVRARQMQWVHLPIQDVSTPDGDFEAAWTTAGESLRARLRSGANVLIHCKGGLGRAGTIAARLLVELGWDPLKAIEVIRSVRPGAIEARAQARHVMRSGPIAECTPPRSLGAVRDRAVGALLGLAVGDAIGTTLEFSARDSYLPLTDMIGGGPFNLEPGEWTDDTSMALALLDSLLAHEDLDEADLMDRFCRWHELGEYSVRGECFDIGLTTQRALARWKKTGDPIAGSTAPSTAGNGSLMRLAPVVIRHWRNRERLSAVAARQSAVTHGAAEAVEACVAFADLLADAIEGQPRSEVFRNRNTIYAGVISSIMAGSWRGKLRSQVRASGYVAHSLEAALWCVSRTDSFEQAVLLAANLGEDADTTAAITGQLAGALYGASHIPDQWLKRLAWSDQIGDLASELFAQSMADHGVDCGFRPATRHGPGE